jgi:hypothetical protein
MRRDKHIIVLLPIACLVGCSHGHLLTRRIEEFRASISLAAEAERFIDHLGEHDYSRHLIKGQFAYLEKQASEHEDKLDQATIGSNDQLLLNVLKSSNKQLAHFFSSEILRLCRVAR